MNELAGETLTPQETERLLAEYRRTGDRALRNRVVEAHLRIARFHVRRFARSGTVAVDDLYQTALMGVIHAAERFETGHGASFRTFATRTVEGELKRYLRDRTWAVRPTRSAQEAHLKVSRGIEELSHDLHRAPTVPELAERLGMSEDQVLEGMEAGGARVADPLEPVGRDPDDSTDESRTGVIDPQFEGSELRIDLRAAFTTLDDREREVLHLRFVEERSQPEIAESIGISQSYVSRIIRGALARLREDLGGTDDPTPDLEEGSARCDEPVTTVH